MSQPKAKYGFRFLVASSIFTAASLGFVYWIEMRQRERRRVNIQHRLGQPAQLDVEEFKAQRRSYEEHVQRGGKLNRGFGEPVNLSQDSKA